MAKLIDLKDINRKYEMGSYIVPALKDISVSIGEGDFIAIKGPSGSGKSTLMHIIGCLDSPSSGRYTLRGKCVETLDKNELSSIRNRHIGFVFQNFNLIPRMTLLKNVELPLLYAKVPAAERREKALFLLKEVGLGKREGHLPNELSGGEKQRAAIARALINDPDIILADEPTGNLDSHASGQIIDIFEGLNRKGITVILITHEDEIAARARINICLRDGMIEETTHGHD